MIKSLLLYLLIFQIMGVSCEYKPTTNALVLETPNYDPHRSSNQDLMYDFAKPNIMVLDKALLEISGLAYSEEKDVLLAHNDEKGHVYELSKTDGTIINDLKFGKKGDYESIEYYDGKYVICSSAGVLHFYDPESTDTEKIKTSLSIRNDVEGMCLNKDSKYLLLACKGQPKEKIKSKNLKAVYAFDLESKTLLADPYLEIRDDELEQLVKKDHAHLSNRKLKKLVKRSKEFSPSGIAIQPMTGQYYVVSARGSTVVVLDKDRSLNQVIFLDDELFKQPEGICFDNESNLYISLEGRGLSAKILVFKKLNNSE